MDWVTDRVLLCVLSAGGVRTRAGTRPLSRSDLFRSVITVCVRVPRATARTHRAATCTVPTTTPRRIITPSSGAARAASALRKICRARSLVQACLAGARPRAAAAADPGAPRAICSSALAAAGLQKQAAFALARALRRSASSANHRAPRCDGGSEARCAPRRRVLVRGLHVRLVRCTSLGTFIRRVMICSQLLGTRGMYRGSLYIRRLCTTRVGIRHPIRRDGGSSVH